MKTILVFLLAFPLALAAADEPVPPENLTAPAADAEMLEDGLAIMTLIEGEGSEHPIETDILEMRYLVWKSDGSLIARIEVPKTATIPIWNMLPGWQTAATRMVVGETQRAWVPSSLGGGKITEGEGLVIDTELVRIFPFPKTPEDVAAPPDDAIRTKSGLAYKVLHPGNGEVFPTRRSRVVVHYTGWTIDGNRFDSSIVKGPPASFLLNKVIRGWTEGMQLMSVGERTRFWIPSKLAYGRQRGKPKGMLVFDIELLDVK